MRSGLSRAVGLCTNTDVRAFANHEVLFQYHSIRPKVRAGADPDVAENDGMPPE